MKYFAHWQLQQTYLYARARRAEAQRAGGRPGSLGAGALGSSTGAEPLGRKRERERKVAVAEFEMGQNAEPVGFRDC